MQVIENGNYTYENGWYKSIFWIYIPYGRGIDLTLSQIKEIKRVVQLEGCQIRFTYKSKNITHAQLVDYTKKSDQKGLAASNLDEQGDNDTYRQVIKKMFPIHWEQYGSVRSDPNATAIQSKMFFLVKAKSVELLQEQIELALEHYKKGPYKEFTQYIELVPMLGAEYKTISEVLTSDLSILDKESDTNLQIDYALIDNFESGVLQDEMLPMPIGSDVNSTKTKHGSITRKAKVLFDFNGHTSHQAIIAIPEETSLKSYKYANKYNDNVVPTASMVSQAAANQITLTSHVSAETGKVHKHKVAHMVLNGFSYKDVENTEMYLDNPKLFTVVDMNKVAINPLQPTGAVEEQDYLYNSYTKKISTLLNSAYNFEFEKPALLVIEKAVKSAYSKRWGDEDNEKKLVGQDNMIFPGLSSFTDYMRRTKDEYLAESMSGKAEDVDTAIDIVTSIVEERKSLLGKKTNFIPPTAYQTYYDFSGISSDELKVVQFINSINTVITSLKEGDCLIIHGFDKIPPEAFVGYLRYELQERAKKKGIRVIYSLDTFITGNGYTVKDYKGVVYNNFDEDFDWQIHGYVPIDKFYELEKLYLRKFNDRVKVNITLITEARVIVRRSSTLTLSMVDIGEMIV